MLYLPYGTLMTKGVRLNKTPDNSTTFTTMVDEGYLLNTIVQNRL